MNIPENEYFNLPVSVWSHSMNAYEPWNTTLGEFLTGEIFDQLQTKIWIKQFLWMFKPNTKNGTAPLIDPQLVLPLKKLLDGKTVSEAVDSLRNYVVNHGKDDVVQAAKRLLPGATISAQFDKRRAKSEPHTVNNLIALDIDNVNTDSTMSMLKSLNICFWISKSVTGTGVYALVPLNTSNLLGHFEAINLLLLEHGIELDPLKDVTRLRYWSPPQDAIINPDVRPFSDVYIIPDEVKMYRGSKENPVLSLGATTKYNTEDFASACHKKGLLNASKNLILEEGQIGEHLHTFIKYYHWAFNHYGIELDYAVKWTWSNFFENHEYCTQKGHTIERIHRDFSSFYKSYKSQHHCFDFEEQKKSWINEERYDLELKLSYGKKLSSLKLPLVNENWGEDGFNSKDNNNWNKYLLDSPTNSGKTSTFTKYFIGNKVKGLIVVPTQGALEQLKQDYPETKVYYEKNKNVSSSDLLICTTYASFEKLYKAIDLTDRFLVVDEFHNVVLSTSKGYRNRELNIILDRIEQFERVVLMTGTNLNCHHPVLKNFRKVKVQYVNDTEKYLQVVYYNKGNRWNTLMSKLNNYKGLQVIYFDNKDESGSLGKLLGTLKQNGYSENEILLANADQKSAPKFQTLVLDGRAPEELKLIIATKIFVEALNLYDKVEAFHILSSIHGAYMQQLVTRPRNNTRCDVYLYWHENALNERDCTYWFDQEKYFNGQVRVAETLIRAYEETEWDDIHRLNFNNNDVIRKRRVKLITTEYGFNSPHEGESVLKLDCDYLNCDFNTQDLQVLFYKRNPDQLYEYLKQYNWIIKQEETSAVGHDLIDNATLKTIKQNREQQVDAFITWLIQEGALENEDVLDEKSYGNISWQIEIRKRYHQLYRNIGEKYANELIYDVGLNKRGFDILMKQIRIRQALIFERSDYRNFAENIFNAFPIGTRWTSGETLKSIQGIQVATFPGISKAKLIKSETAATQLLNTYIETKRAKKIDPNGVPTKGRKNAFKNALEIVSHHPIRAKNGEPIEPVSDRKSAMDKRDKRMVRNYKRLEPFDPEFWNVSEEQRKRWLEEIPDVFGLGSDSKDLNP